jgi:hypothetical protein
LACRKSIILFSLHIIFVRIILSERGSFLGKSGELFRITRKDEPEVLIPAPESGADSGSGQRHLRLLE